MKNRLELIFFILGGLSLVYLLWFFYVDGVYVNRPIVFTNGVDPNNYGTDKHTYHRGDIVKAYTSFCKTREATGIVQWVITDSYNIPYKQQDERNFPVGCYPQHSKTELFDIEKIPEFALYGCDYAYEGTLHEYLNFGRVITYPLKTKTFCVVP